VTSKKDLEQIYDEANHLKATLVALAKKYTPEVHELGENNEPAPMPVGNEEAAQMRKEGAPADKPLPAAVRLPPTVDHTKDIISSCVYNVQATAQSMNGVITYANCLKASRPTEVMHFN